MSGRQDSRQSLFACVRLEDMIPHDHILRRIRAAIDFSFIDRLTAPLYSPTGRPSVDPQVLVRMMWGLSVRHRLGAEAVRGGASESGVSVVLKSVAGGSGGRSFDVQQEPAW